MVQISIFSIVLTMFLFHIILANLVNWALRKIEDSGLGIALCLIYFVILSISIKILYELL